MNGTAQDVCQALAADVRDVGLTLVCGLYSLAERWWLAGSAPQPPLGLGTTGLVWCVAGRQHLVHDEEDPALVAMEDTQEWVIDELWHGWPELWVGGSYAGLLQPGLAAPGAPAWELGDHRVPLGGLAHATIARPPHWSVGG